jgi:hypothetical protein
MADTKQLQHIAAAAGCCASAAAICAALLTVRIGFDIQLNLK